MDNIEWTVIVSHQKHQTNLNYHAILYKNEKKWSQSNLMQTYNGHKEKWLSHFDNEKVLDLSPELVKVIKLSGQLV